MDKFLAMQAFVRVVESGTFAKAADMLDLPKPTLTRLIQGLEGELHTKLLNRTTRRMSVTDDGAAYYERAVRLLSEMAEMESCMSGARSKPRGRLRVDVPASLALSVIIPALPDFRGRYPDIQVDLGVTDRPVDLLSENIDCVIRGGAITDQSLVARQVALVDFTVCATPAYLATRRLPGNPHELVEGYCVIRSFSARSGKMFPFVLSKDGERFEVECMQNVNTNDSSAALAACLAGLGIVQLASVLVQPYLDRGELQALLPDWRSDPASVYVVYPANRHLSVKVRVFVDWIIELFEAHPLLRLEGRQFAPT
ncbi:LysR family transcriptional regulator [Chitinimonas naiadis]